MIPSHFIDRKVSVVIILNVYNMYANVVNKKQV